MSRFLFRSTAWGLGNLIRCALEAPGVSPGITEATHACPLLVLAAATGSAPAVQALLAGGAKTELAGRNGITALMFAARHGHLPCLRLLLDAEANASARDEVGNTPLMVAVMLKDVDCVRALLPASNVSDVNRIGHNALHVAVNTDSELCFEPLLLACDVNARTGVGVDARSGQASLSFSMTALHFACQYGQAQMCKALLSRGADRMARNSGQWTPLHLAVAGAHMSCVFQLVGVLRVRMTPAELDAATDGGLTALHLAAAKGFDKICGLLVGAGAVLDAKTPGGDTPHMLAQRYHPASAALLALLSGACAPHRGFVCDLCGKTAAEASVKACRRVRNAMSRATAARSASSRPGRDTRHGAG